MKREITLEEISDGALYGLNDMVKADCGDCMGCFACCQGMGDSIVLDPLDICRLWEHLNMGFDQLLSSGRIGLHVEEGIILPNLAMAGERERCSFLSGEGRCTIHGFRPGICRIFPLGRYYGEDGFQYFLQVHECKKEHRTKVKVRKWIDTPDVKNNQDYLSAWHQYLLSAKEAVKTMEESGAKELNMHILNHFFRLSYTSERQFYEEFAARLKGGRP